jgi:recombination protein RecR
MYTAAVQDLIDELGRLPGIGPKSAQRIAFHLLSVSKDEALRLAQSITAAKDRVSWCRRCFNIAEMQASLQPGPGLPPPVSSDPAGDAGTVLCDICRDTRRDPKVICVVEESRDVVAMEKTREFRGLYHVLGGAISPIDGIGPDRLRVRELIARISPEGVEEVILATNPNIEGEATALYLTKLLGHMPLKVTQLASGLPVGGDLEYADELTLGRALEGRRTIGG